MQLRHLRYFVGIVDAGSFSRAANTLHVAQPALSQQIAELEESLGVPLLQRHARGVRSTPAGEVLYREAVAILRQIEQLPGIVRSTGGEPEGTVSLGMSSTLADGIGGSFIQSCRSLLPKVMVKFKAADSETLKADIARQRIDLALAFEDELVAGFSRRPMFRQRLYYVASGTKKAAGTISLQRLSELTLVLPGKSNIVRRLLDRQFAALGITPRIASEGDQLSTIMSMVHQGLGGTVLPRGRWRADSEFALAPPMLIEPPLFLTASVLWSGEAASSRAAEAVKFALIDFVTSYIRDEAMPGLELVQPAGPPM